MTRGAPLGGTDLASLTLNGDKHVLIIYAWPRKQFLIPQFTTWGRIERRQRKAHRMQSTTQNTSTKLKDRLQQIVCLCLSSRIQTHNSRNSHIVLAVVTSPKRRLIRHCARLEIEGIFCMRNKSYCSSVQRGCLRQLKHLSKCLLTEWQLKTLIH